MWTGRKWNTPDKNIIYGIFNPYVWNSRPVGHIRPGTQLYPARKIILCQIFNSPMIWGTQDAHNTNPIMQRNSCRAKLRSFPLPLRHINRASLDVTASQPVCVDVETGLIQTALIQLQCTGTLKAKYNTVWPRQFPRFIPEAVPQLRPHTTRTLCMFGSD